MPTRRAVLSALAAGPVASWTSATAQPAGETFFESAGRRITVEGFGGGGGAGPAVMLLHGSDGPGPRYRTAARVLASTGQRVFLVHYFDRTGDKRAAFREISTKLPAWAAAAQDGLAHVAAQPGVDARRVGVLGISLGGGLGLLTAASEPRVRAFVNWFGFVPTGFSRPSRLPPTLVLHGAQDRVVPADNARALERILTAAGTPHEVVIYPGQGHGFTGDAQIDAARRTAAFLGQWMG